MKNKQSSYMLYGIYVIAFVLLNLISMNYFMRIDLTDNQMYSLSNSSKSTIDKIDDPLNIDLYFSDDLPGQLQNNKRYIQDLLEEYVAYSNNINFYFIKNDENFASTAQSDGIQSQDIQVIENDEVTFKTIFMGMKLRYNGKSEVLPMLGVSSGLEYTLTRTIKKLIDDKQHTVGIAQFGTAPLSTENLNTILGERFIIKNNVSFDNPENQDLDLLMIGNVEGNLTDADLEGLSTYLNNGGKIFISQGRVKADIQSGQGILQESNLFDFLDAYGLRIESNLVLDQECKQLIARQQSGIFSIQRQIDYPFIPSITNFQKSDDTITGLEGLQVIQLAFPSEITLTDTTSKNEFIPLLQTSNNSAVMSDQFNLGAMPEINSILNNLNESSKLIGGKLLLESGGEIVLITDSQFFDDNSVANMRLVRNDINENYTFMENIIDVMLGDAELVSLRSREIVSRPLIDEAQGKENSSLRTRWKWINLLLPSILIIGYGMFRKRMRNQRQKYLMESYG